MSDLRALLIGLVTTFIAHYALKAFDGYLARRTVRSRQRQIEQLAGELRQLEKLGVADRALLLFAFQMLFALIGLAAAGMAGSVVLPFLRGGSGDPIPMIQLLLSFVIAILAFYTSSVFLKLQDPEPSLEKIRQKMRELQAIEGKDAATKGGS